MINPKKIIVKNLIMLGMFVLFGICCIIFKKTGSEFIGCFTGGTVVCVLNLFRALKMMKNPEFKKQVEIEAEDERTKMINSKTIELVSFIMIMIMCFGAFTSIIFEKSDYLYILAGLLIIYAVLYFVIRAVYNKKY